MLFADIPLKYLIKMTHKCEKCESDKMQDLVYDNRGTFRCRSCGEEVKECDIHHEILNKFKGKRR